MISFTIADVNQLNGFTLLTFSIEKKHDSSSSLRYESFINIWPENIYLLRQILEQSLSGQNSLEDMSNDSIVLGSIRDLSCFHGFVAFDGEDSKIQLIVEKNAARLLLSAGDVIMRGTNAGKIFYSNYTSGRRNGSFRIKIRSDGFVGSQNRHGRAVQEANDNGPNEEVAVDSLALIAEIESLKKEIDNLKTENENNIKALKARHSLEIARLETEHLESDTKGMVSICLHEQEMENMKTEFEEEKARFQESKAQTELHFVEGVQTLEKKQDDLAMREQSLVEREQSLVEREIICARRETK
jgi:hypothetical protein